MLYMLDYPRDFLDPHVHFVDKVLPDTEKSFRFTVLIPRTVQETIKSIILQAHILIFQFYDVCHIYNF